MKKYSKDITIDAVLEMTEPTEEFIVNLEDNKPGIRFNGFRLRDMDTGEIYHQYYPSSMYELDYFSDHVIAYNFGYKILKAKTIGTTLILCIGDATVHDLDLIERHYVEGELAANYHFKFPLFMPNSRNTIEFIYSVPTLSKKVEELINKGEDVYAKSDTFLFVEGKLMVHRRATYDYFNEL